MDSINTKRSYTEYEVTEPTTDFAIGFDNYSGEDKDAIHITLDGVNLDNLDYTVVRKNAQVIEVTPAITSGVVRLQRETYIDQAFHKFTAGALFSPKAMDENFEQVRHSQREVLDEFQYLEVSTGGILKVTAEAREAATRAVDAAAYAESLDVVQLEQDVGALKLDVEKQGTDTGVTVVPKGVGAVERTQAGKNIESLTVKDFGGVGDGVADDTVAIQNAINYAAANRIKLRITNGKYRITSYIVTRSNLHMVFDTGAWILPTKWSPVGAILTNVSRVPSERVQTNITIENPQMDGQFLPYDDPSSNDNAIGFARGASFVRIHDGYIKNFKYNFVTGGAGGKAVNFEGGVTDSCLTGTLTAENCSVALFVQASVIGVTTRIQCGNVLAINCESAAQFLGIDVTTDPDGSPKKQFVSVGNILAYNCGHTPNRPVNGYQPQKSGVVVFGEAQNIHIESVTAYNDAEYPMNIGYPSVESGLVGGGLSGAIGAVIWGWGRNIHIGSVTYHGACDYLVYFGRARAVGDDAAPSSYPANCWNFNIDQFNHVGAATYVVGLQANMPVGVVTGNLRNIQTDTISTLVTAQGDRHKDLFLKVTRKDGYEISGRLSTLFAKYNAIGSYVPTADITLNRSLATNGLYGTDVQTIADDGRYFLNPERKQGVVLVTSQNSMLNFMFYYRINAVPQIGIIGTPPPQVAALPSGLTGTFGLDGDFTVGCNNATLYFENRRGGSVTVNITYLG